MPELKIPSHPTHDYACKKCRFWLESEAINIVYLQTNGGIQLVPVSEMIKQGQPVNDGMISARVAPCTKFPKWESCAGHHWCHQYEGRSIERDDGGKGAMREMPFGA